MQKKISLLQQENIVIQITIDHYTIKDMQAVNKTAGDNPKKIKAIKFFILIFIAVIITGFFIPSENISTKFVCYGAVLLFCSIVALIQETLTIPAQSLASFKNLQKHHNNSPICICFDENYWSTSFGNNKKNIKEFNYISTYSAEETDEYFFMSQQKNEYFCIPKNCFTYGTPDELRKLLTNKLCNKFKIK